MKKPLHVDEHFLRDAKAASGAKTDTDTVRLGLEALVRRAAYGEHSSPLYSELTSACEQETREALKMSRHVFAFKLGVNPRTLERWEQGRSKPPVGAKLLRNSRSWHVRIGQATDQMRAIDLGTTKQGW